MLRNWHSREAKIVRNMKEMYQNSEDVAKALERGKSSWQYDDTITPLSLPTGDLQTLGECLNKGQKQKVVMAPG